mgnify:CR=1 FL=1
MVKIDSFLIILNNMPLLLEYFVPGFVTLSIFSFFVSRKHSKYFIVNSVVVSYILRALCISIHSFICKKHKFEWNERIIWLMVIAVIVSIIMIFLYDSKIVNFVFRKINYKSIHDNIWRDVIDYKNGTTMRFICEDVSYIGVLAEHEENGNDSWFVLEKYIIEENGSEISYKDIKEQSKIAINLKDVKRVELYYSDK